MKQDLTVVRETADQYVTDTLHEFDPFEWSDSDKSELRRKAFSELALYLYVQREHDEGNAEIRSHIAEHVNDSHFADLLRRYPSQFGKIALPAIVIDAIGNLQPETSSRKRSSPATVVV